MSFHPKVLGPSQRRLLKKLAPFAAARGFHLGGGTALAIHLGHRRSVDFDWFTPDHVADPSALAADLAAEGFVAKDAAIERGTLRAAVNGVHTSFIEYRYPALAPYVSWPAYRCTLASLEDIACMKLSAVAQRGSKRDFFDVYALCTRFKPLGELLSLYRRRYRAADLGPVLYGLVFFDDAERERGPAMIWKLEWPAVKKAITSWVVALR
jgi:hypothetical protein